MSWKLAGLVLAASQTASQPAPRTEPNWSATYQSDLAFTYDVVKREHPAAAPPRDDAFYVRLEAAYRKARAEHPRSYAGYAYGLSHFVAGLRDQHSIFLIDSGRAGESWPGFMVGLRNGQVVVVDHVDRDAPPLGARLIRCGTRSVATLTAQSLAGTMHPDSPTTPKWKATYIFINGDPHYAAPTRCVFAHNGVSRGYDIRYAPLGTNASRLFPAAFGTPPGIAASEIADGVFWVGLPTFSESDQVRAELASVVEYLRRNRERMREGKAIVFDVRGNGGGYFIWGAQILSTLFGEEYAAGLAPKDEAVNYWRASAAHATHLRSVAANVMKISGDSKDAKRWTDIADRVEAAAKAGEPFWRDPDRPAGAGGGLTKRRPTGDAPFRAKLVFLADGMCASACLMFADRLLSVPGVTHIGGPTNADGVYTQIRLIAMPSGLGNLQLSQVAIRGGARGDMERFDPDIPFDGEWATAALQAWTLRLIATGQLTGPRPSASGRR